MKRFEAIFEPGEPNERMPEWQVVEWTYVHPDNGSKSGRIVKRFWYDDYVSQQQAEDLAYILNHEYSFPQESFSDD